MTNSASLTPSREQQQIHRPGTLDFSHGTFPLEGPSEELEKISPVTPMGFLGNSGILRLFEPDHRRIATSEQRDMRSPVVIRTDLPPLELQQSFAESYFEFCWPWCPILDKNTLFDELEHTPSVLLTNALALLGTRIRPPTIQHATASEYYNRAKMLFYTDDEDNPIVSLQAIMLFYWWAPRSPLVVHKDAAWWWTGLAIKYAQQMGMHREPKNVQDVGGDAVQGLRRRIWWTLFARERLTALCQGRPCIINPDDCNVCKPSIEDFTPRDPRADVFIYWVRLCSIIGRVGQHLSRHTEEASFPTQLALELIDWAGTLPEHLALPDTSHGSRKYDRDVFLLHLPYLTTITVLHMNWSSHHPSQPLPEAYTTAVLSASCVARLIKELFARGHVAFLGAIATWYVGVAIVALVHTQRIERLTESGAEDLRSLRLALDALASLWPTGAIFVRGFERMKIFENLGTGLGNDRRTTIATEVTTDATSPVLSDVNWLHGIDWQSYFPNVTTQTSSLAAILLADDQPMTWDELCWIEDPTVQLQNFFDPSEAFSYLHTDSSVPL